jgi:hypothetical protein
VPPLALSDAVALDLIHQINLQAAGDLGEAWRCAEMRHRPLLAPATAPQANAANPSHREDFMPSPTYCRRAA